CKEQQDGTSALLKNNSTENKIDAEDGGTAFLRSDPNLDNSRCCTSYIFGPLTSDISNGELNTSPV
ncbi:MAG: hypothetical protein ACQET3_11975, partial [Promethearchaeati archaeon]